MSLSLRIGVIVLGLSSLCSLSQGQDLTWDNNSGNSLWDTTSVNWTGSTWTNGYGAIFGTLGSGSVNLSGPIQANSLNFQANGYSINGAGPLTLVSGTSTQTTGVVNVGTGVSASINSPISSAVGFRKHGEGNLVLSGSGNSFANVIALDGGGNLQAGLMVGRSGLLGVSDPLAGRVVVTGASVLPSTVNVGISNGYLDIGSNNVTVANLYFTNQNQPRAWDSSLNANNGVIGTGTLRVLGEIHVMGQGGVNAGNSIAANLDLGGGTQVVRVGAINSFMLNRGVMFTGSLSNGSLKKSIGITAIGSIGSVDGISLFGNNTYTGDTIFNSGTNVITGTNATQSLTIAGIGGPGGSRAILQGANGSILSATNIRAHAIGQFIIDNTAAEGASGNNAPNIPAAQNNNRISDSAAIELRDGSFIYRTNATAVTGGEVFGSLNIAGGYNQVLIAPNGSTTTLSATDLTIDPRATLNIGTAGAAGTAILGTHAKLLFSGTVPAADSTGIIRGIVSGSSTIGIAQATTPTDLVTYDSVDGFKAYTTYATDFSTSGTNVAIAASTATNTQNINALKTTGSITTTVNAGQTLTVDSGMMLSASGTNTVAGGTVNFGSNPGMIIGSTTFASDNAMSGTNGLIHASGTLTLNGDMSGLTGTLNANSTGSLNLNTNTFSGPIQVRVGTLTLGVNQTGSGLGAITLGVPENADDIFYGTPTLSWTTSVTQVDRDIIVDNGGTNLDGLLPSDSLIARLAPSNYTTDRFFTGDITLNSDLAIYGGSATGSNTGWNHFQGNISGDSRLLIRNGRVSLDAGSTWSNDGGMIIGASGNSVQMAFLGTGTGTGNITLYGSTTGSMGIARYDNDQSFGAGSITVASGGSTGLTFEAVGNSSINNQVNLNHTNASVFIDVAAGVTADWAGIVSGNGAINKTGTGTWVASGNANTYTGTVNVNAGSLFVDGNLASSANLVIVSSSGLLGGTGVIDRDVVVNGTLAPGNSPGILTINGDATLNSTAILAIELNGASAGTQYDRLVVNGDVNLNGSTLSLVGGYDPLPATSYFILVNDGTDAINGTFAGLAEGSTVSFTFGSNTYTRILTYLADFEGNSFSGGNDIALISVVPEPSLGLVGLIGFGGLILNRRIRRR